jgi:hypothetical protein
MVDPEILTDTIVEWFATLNYEYMLLHIIICYGLYYSKNMSWIVQRFSPVRKKGIARGVWLTGGFLALMEVLRFVPLAWENSIGITVCVDKVISIFHSYILIQVFVDPIVNAVHRWLEILHKTSKN